MSETALVALAVWLPTISDVSNFHENRSQMAIATRPASASDIKYAVIRFSPVI
jgi:hypothetical protein